jgi:DNA-binding SARP family transcriptional activator
MDLRGPEGEEILSVLSQPKRAILLTYLAVAHPRGFHTREKLFGLFWPEQDGEHARSALRSSLYFLRSSLNDELLRSRSDEEVGLDHERIWCDAVAFEEAAAGGDVAEALDLYRGDLLEGVFLPDCPEFERWLDEERERLREIAAGAAWTLAHRQIEEGRLVEAERTGQRALGLVGTDESAVREFIAALADAGDRAGAIRFYEKFASGLRRDLDLEPSALTQEVAAEIRATVGSPRISITYLRLLAASTIGLSGTGGIAVESADLAPVGWYGRPVVSWGFAAVLALFAALALWALLFTGAGQVTRTYVQLASPNGEPVPQEFAVSPDGSKIFAPEEDGIRMWARDRLESEWIPTAGSPSYVTVSPSGDSIGYTLDHNEPIGELRIAPLSGGGHNVLARERAFPAGFERPFDDFGESAPQMPSWGDDGMVYWAQDFIIYRAPAEGGDPERFTDKEEAQHFYPDVLPEGRGLILNVRTGRTNPGQANWIAAVGPEGGKPKPLFQGTWARYVSSGHLLYTTVGGQLNAIRFDPKRLKTIGDPVTIADDFLREEYGKGLADVSEEGTLWYLTRADPGGYFEMDFLWQGLDGSRQVDATWRGRYSNPRLSPDDRSVAVESEGAIWIHHFNVPGAVQMTEEEGAGSPRWTPPDGDFLTYALDEEGRGDVWMAPLDLDERPPHRILDRPRRITEVAWSPDGNWLVYATHPEDEGKGDILAIAANGTDTIPGDREPRVLAAHASETEATERLPAVSPDGRWLAYLSDESGEDQIWLAPFPNPGNQRWMLTDTERGVPYFTWTHSGREIFFYRRRPASLLAIEVDSARAPDTWSTRVAMERFSTLSPWDVTKDDQALLLVRPLGLAFAPVHAPDRMVRVDNFFAFLKRELGG